jgi:hypothetical protein
VKEAAAYLLDNSQRCLFAASVCFSCPLLDRCLGGRARWAVSNCSPWCCPRKSSHAYIMDSGLQARRYYSPPARKNHHCIPSCQSAYHCRCRCHFPFPSYKYRSNHFSQFEDGNLPLGSRPETAWIDTGLKLMSSGMCRLKPSRRALVVFLAAYSGYTALV